MSFLVTFPSNNLFHKILTGFNTLVFDRQWLSAARAPEKNNVRVRLMSNVIRHSESCYASSGQFISLFQKDNKKEWRWKQKMMSDFAGDFIPIKA